MPTQNEFLLAALKNTKWRVAIGDRVRWWNPLSYLFVFIRPTKRLCHELFGHFRIDHVSHPTLSDAFKACTQTGLVILPVKDDTWEKGGWRSRWALNTKEGVNRRKFLDDLITYVAAVVETENAER